MEKEIYEDLFKNVVINGNYPLEKLNEMKSYIDTLIIKIDNLETQLKKQQEINQKAIEYIKTHLDEHFKTEFDYITTSPQVLLQILEDKEV